MNSALAGREAGLGIAPVPAFFLGRREYQSLCILPLTDPVVSVDLGSVVSRNHPPRSIARQALAIIEQVCSSDWVMASRRTGDQTVSALDTGPT